MDKNDMKENTVKVRIRTWNLGRVFLLLLGIGWTLTNVVMMFRAIGYVDKTGDTLVPFIITANAMFYMMLVLFCLTNNLYVEYEVEMKGKKVRDSDC